ncbi:hypothetical protein MY11210_006578 [Beauveria gryllotalpidicola]
MASKLKSLYNSARSVASRETNDPPPAYTATAATSSSTAAAAAASADDNPFAFLCDFDTVFLIDDSSSMNGRAGSHSHSAFPSLSSLSCWDEVAAVLRAIVPICTAHDADGIDLYFLNHRSPAPPSSSSSSSPPPGKARGGYYNIRSAAAVSAIFRSVGPPCGVTPTGRRLEAILAPYLAGLEEAAQQQQQQSKAGQGVKKKKKPMNVIVITDGRPTDDPAGVLVEAASRLVAVRAPAAQLGVQFFQVGRDAGARAALQELDDGLAEYSGRDIVDCVTWDDGRAGRGALTADGILKVVLGAVSRRLDWKSMDGGDRRPATNVNWGY